MTDSHTAAHATQAPAPAHYRLSIELTAHTSPDTRDGEPGEVVMLAELVATDEATGRRWVYVGRTLCATRSQALALHASIFAWERRTGRSFDPTKEPASWAADRQPAEDGAAAEGAVAQPEPVAHAEPEPVAQPEPAAVEVVPAPVKVRRPRRVDAAKARRLGKEAAALARAVGVTTAAVV
jgi:hypothetical protein